MRLSVRFVVPLAICLALVAYAVVPLVDALTFRWFVRDLDMRSQLIANTMGESLSAQLAAKASPSVRAQIQAALQRATQDERLYAVALCSPEGGLIYATNTFPRQIACPKAGHVADSSKESVIMRLQHGPLHVATAAVTGGWLVLVHDMSFVERRSQDTKRYVFYLFVALGAIISIITVIIAQLSWRGWVTGLRAMLKGERLLQSLARVKTPELRPLARDLRALIQDLESDRRVRDESQITWSPKALRQILRDELAGDEILIVSNREPYIHNRDKEGKIEIQVPASGLVTALEPVMRACSGTWIAHGSGSADRDVVDERDRVAVPPGKADYSIRRIWLSQREEAGYYYGFSNEGLWPLCHIAHTRPTFRTSDWNTYVDVNRKFAAAVCDEARTEDPVILVQDYHLALLPRMIRKRLPGATIMTFWHIPWPNPEAFGICPWREEILQGILGSSVVGFHTKFHCNNFIDTVDRILEARIDRETSEISYGGKLTAVKNYPISIEWPSRWLDGLPGVDVCRKNVITRHGFPEGHKIGIGVDRLDYTKGVLERFAAVERMMELEPGWIGKFSLVQIAAPSRSTIEQYQSFDQQVRAMADRVNQRFGRGGALPIVLLVQHHEPGAVFEYFRAADVCMVTSLHDGMNLVAKEFAAARDDERGVLILSQFTGASRELPEALIVNPYNTDQCAAALHLALTMSHEEQKTRMQSMRALIQEFNVYRWAGRMLLDASRVRKRDRLMGRIAESESSLLNWEANGSGR